MGCVHELRVWCAITPSVSHWQGLSDGVVTFSVAHGSEFKDVTPGKTFVPKTEEMEATREGISCM